MPAPRHSIDEYSDETQPTRVNDPVEQPPLQPPVWMPPPAPPPAPPPPRRKRRIPQGCASLLLAALILLAAYLLLPLPAEILLLGTDSRETGIALGRTDTMVMTTINPLTADVRMLSLPRDLWVNIPGYGENRINAAFFFYEADQPGSGAAGAIETLQANFGVRMEYYVLFEFDGIVRIVDALGGVDVDLPRAMSGYEAGTHRLDGTAALAFVRDRSGSDDFFRMERGQIFIRAFIREILSPRSWRNLPAMFLALPAALETDLPIWHIPRLAVAILRAGPDGIEGASISREMVTPFTTDAGASVLLPNWELINPVVEEMFDP
jgi:LCP family protein required for cell wall assembly